MKVVPVKVETVFLASKSLPGKELIEKFSIPGSGQEAIVNARRHYPGYRLQFLGFFFGEGDSRRFKPADLSTEVAPFKDRN